MSEVPVSYQVHLIDFLFSLAHPAYLSSRFPPFFILLNENMSFGSL